MCKYNVSVNNTTLYFVYNKNSVLSGRHVSTFIRSSSSPLRKKIQELSIFQCIVESQMHWNIDSSLDLFSQRAWGWPNKGRNMSPWQYTVFIVYKIKCCVIGWHVVFICYNTSGWKALNKMCVVLLYSLRVATCLGVKKPS